MSYTIIDNIEMPESTRTRTKGAFSIALAGLEVGQGFEFTAKGTLKSQYPRVSPKKNEGKRFKLADGSTEGTFKVKRVA